MAETKKRRDPEPPAPADDGQAAPGVPAAESADPVVHGLLADLDAVRAAGDTAAQVRILGRLQTLGYSA